jgi:hypothetical protein
VGEACFAWGDRVFGDARGPADSDWWALMRDYQKINQGSQSLERITLSQSLATIKKANQPLSQLIGYGKALK